MTAWGRIKDLFSRRARQSGVPPVEPPGGGDPMQHMRSEIARIRAEWPVRLEISRRFVDLSDEMYETVRSAVLKAGGKMFAWEGGAHDLEDHIYRRLELDRVQTVPWLLNTFPLADALALEIGCGAGSSKVALAEQGRRLTSIDVDESSLEVAAIRCRSMGIADVQFRTTNGADIGDAFPAASFDCIAFVATLEHIILTERRRALSAAWVC